MIPDNNRHGYLALKYADWSEKCFYPAIGTAVLGVLGIFFVSFDTIYFIPFFIVIITGRIFDGLYKKHLKKYKLDRPTKKQLTRLDELTKDIEALRNINTSKVFKHE